MNQPAKPRLFLSASIPLPTRHRVYFDTADILAIRDAIRALTIVIIEQEVELVFGGHPAITPMIRLQVAQTGVPVGEHIVMYQSRFFEHKFPPDNVAFERIELVDAVPNDRDASLRVMREAMLEGEFLGAFFIGGMEGVEEEYVMFSQLQPGLLAFPIASTGAAAAQLFESNPELQRDYPELRDEISYLTLMRDLFAKL